MSRKRFITLIIGVMLPLAGLLPLQGWWDWIFPPFPAFAPAAPTITGGPAAGSTDATGDITFSWTGESGGFYQCSLGTGAPSFSTCLSPKSYLDLPSGSYTFQVRQVDDALNVGATTTRSFIVDVSTPIAGGFNPGVGKVDLADCDSTLAAGGNLETFVNNLSSGQVGCLRDGLYTDPNFIQLQGSGGWKLGAVSGERAVYRGAFDMLSVNGVELEGFSIDGSYSPETFENARINTHQSINLRASTSTVVDSMDIQNRRTANLSGTCIFGGTAQRATITYSYIHTCGELPNTNHEHGVYVANSHDTLIEHSWFEDIADRGISYHSSVVNARSNGVVVNSHNGAPGWLYGAAQNTITENSIGSVEPSWTVSIGPAGAGSGNISRNNCGNQGFETGTGLTQSDNVQVEPVFSGFKVTGPSTCLAKLPADSPFRP